MDLSKAQAGAEMAPADPAAAALGEAHGRGGMRAARALLGAMPAGRRVESHRGSAAPLLFKTVGFLLFLFFPFFFPLPSFKFGPSWLLCTSTWSSDLSAAALSQTVQCKMSAPRDYCCV